MGEALLGMQHSTPRLNKQGKATDNDVTNEKAEGPYAKLRKGSKTKSEKKSQKRRVLVRKRSLRCSKKDATGNCEDRTNQKDAEEKLG